MRVALLGGVLLLACATSEGVGVPTDGSGGAPTGGDGGTVAMGGASGSAGWPAGGTAGSAGSTTGGAGGSGGPSGGAGGTSGGSGGSGGTSASGGSSGTGATGGGGTGGTPACAIQGCVSGTESMSGCTAARTIGRKTAAVSPYFVSTASTCSAVNKSTGYDATNCSDFGRDHVYRVFMRKGESIDVSVTQGVKCSAATSWDRVFKIYGSSGCTDTTCSQKIACAMMGSGTYAKSYTALADGWHFLVVDGRTAATSYDDSGSYSITVKLSCKVSGCEC